MNRLSMSPWTNFLDESYKDPNHMYKEEIAVRLEELIAKTTCELMKNEGEHTVEDAKELAISLLMQQLLTIQNEHTPKAQAAMTVALFSDLPSLQQFKLDLLDEMQKSNPSILDAIKNKINRLKNKNC